MPRSYNLRLPPDWRQKLTKDPRTIVRAVLGVLLLANLIAAYAVMQPVGGSAEELDAQITELQAQMQAKQVSLQRARALVTKIEQARTSGDEFLAKYFMDRRTTSSTIISELDHAAKQAGMKSRGATFNYDAIEGSESLAMMTINANYEGTYGDLLQFVNHLDKSSRFLILDNLVAQPQQGGGVLNVAVKLNTFVRDAQVVQQ